MNYLVDNERVLEQIRKTKELIKKKKEQITRRVIDVYANAETRNQ